MACITSTVRRGFVSERFFTACTDLTHETGCWIRAEYSVQRTATDFAFMWTTTLCNIVIYGILFLNFRGYITTDGRHLQLLRNPETFNAFASVRQAYGLLLWDIFQFSSRRLQLTLSPCLATHSSTP